jgi:hypothetical protein
MNRCQPVLALGALFVLICCGCGSLLPSVISSGPDYTLHVVNNTTLGLTIEVNGQNVGVVAARSGGAFTPTRLPGLPWTVNARPASGRVVLSLDVAAGSVIETVGPDGATTHRAPGARADLSCGRLDVYVGSIPMLGPAPGPGIPGDCLP